MGEETEKLVFNSGIAYVNEIFDYIKLSNQACVQHNGELWVQSLRVLYGEMVSLLKEHEIEEAKKLYSAMLKEYNDFISKKQHHNNQKITITPKLDMACMNLGLFLRKILHNNGILTPKMSMNESVFT